MEEFCLFTYLLGDTVNWNSTPGCRRWLSHSYSSSFWQVVHGASEWIAGLSSAHLALNRMTISQHRADKIIVASERSEVTGAWPSRHGPLCNDKHQYQRLHSFWDRSTSHSDFTYLAVCLEYWQALRPATDVTISFQVRCLLLTDSLLTHYNWTAAVTYDYPQVAAPKL